MGKMVNITDEERERRRQNMLQLHEEGRAGGQFGIMGGRPKKPRASEQIAEKVSQKADEYFERLDGIILRGGEKTAISAFKELMTIEERERKIEVEAEEKIDELRREELLELVSTQLRELADSGIIPDTYTVRDAEIVGNEGVAEISEESYGS